MSTVADTSASTISSLLSSITGSGTTSADTAASTGSDDTTSSTTSTTDGSAAYNLDITPGLIRAAVANTYDTQIITGSLSQTTGDSSAMDSAVLHDYYQNLSPAAMKYVLSQTYGFLSTASPSTTGTTGSTDSTGTTSSTASAADSSTAAAATTSANSLDISV